jgi:hypothetical protein
MDDFNNTAQGRFFPRELVVGQGREKVELSLRPHGRDWLLTIGGGDTHVGAVAVVAPTTLQEDQPHESLTVVPGHKEGPLALLAARRVAEVTGRTCVCLAGVHQNQATESEIQAIVSNIERGTSKLLGD